MNPLTEVMLIVQRELLRNFRSVKGILLAVITLLGGGGGAMLLAKGKSAEADLLRDHPEVTAEHVQELRKQAYEEILGRLGGYDAATVKHVLPSPPVLWILLYLTLWLTPLLIVLLGFDNVSSELQHKAVRYWTVRTRRGSYFVGKFLGLLATVALITLSMHVIIWLVCIARGEATAAETFAWGVRFWLTSLPVSAAWCSVATLVGSLFRQPFLALLMICASFCALWVFWPLSHWVDGLVYLYPNHYDKLLLSPQLSTAFGGLAACLAFTFVGVGGGALVFNRRDV